MYFLLALLGVDARDARGHDALEFSAFAIVYLSVYD